MLKKIGPESLDKEHEALRNARRQSYRCPRKWEDNLTGDGNILKDAFEFEPLGAVSSGLYFIEGIS
jgi:hypothetical protein